jgi:hypothetical protein
MAALSFSYLRHRSSEWTDPATFMTRHRVASAMNSQGQITLTLLHDLALLYLGLAHGADDDLDPQETMEIAAKLRRWQPDKDPALIDHVIREATLTYLNGANDQRMNEAVQVLGGQLGKPLLKSILADLVDIARADGVVVTEERSFISEIASAWNLEITPPN